MNSDRRNDYANQSVERQPARHGGEALLDTYYPVGRIYFSTVNVSPASFMGGSWTRIQDRFLLCAGTSYAAGSTGGAANVTLTTDQMPSHSHGELVTVSSPTGGWYSRVVADVGQNEPTVEIRQTAQTGGGQAHNNMPPYRAVYAWGRVA